MCRVTVDLGAFEVCEQDLEGERVRVEGQAAGPQQVGPQVTVKVALQPPAHPEGTRTMPGTKRQEAQAQARQKIGKGKTGALHSCGSAKADFLKRTRRVNNIKRARIFSGEREAEPECVVGVGDGVRILTEMQERVQ